MACSIESRQNLLNKNGNFLAVSIHLITINLKIKVLSCLLVVCVEAVLEQYTERNIKICIPVLNNVHILYKVIFNSVLHTSTK